MILVGTLPCQSLAAQSRILDHLYKTSFSPASSKRLLWTRFLIISNAVSNKSGTYRPLPQSRNRSLLPDPQVETGRQGDRETFLREVNREHRIMAIFSAASHGPLNHFGDQIEDASLGCFSQCLTRSRESSVCQFQQYIYSVLRSTMSLLVVGSTPGYLGSQQTEWRAM